MKTRRSRRAPTAGIAFIDSAPTVTNQNPLPGATINTTNVDIDVTFSEPVTGVDATDMVLTGPAASVATVGAPTNIIGNTWRFPVSGLVDGTLRVSLAPDADDIEDVAGNDLANVTWQYPVDVILTVIAIDPAPGTTITTQSVNIDVTFSRWATGVDATDMVLTGSAASNATIGTPTNTIGNTWRFPVRGLRDGVLDVSLAPDADDIEDAAGNDLANVTWQYPVAIATGPRLSAVHPNDGELFSLDADNVLNVAPRELNLLFKGGADIDEGTLDGIRITRAAGNGRFDVASIRTDLGTGGQVVVDIEAINLGVDENGIELILTERDRGADSGPVVSVAGTLIAVELNRHPGSETKAGTLVAALNEDPEASALLKAEINEPLSAAAAPADVKVTDYILEPASVTTDFGTGTYEVRFTARDSGNSGTNLSVRVNKQPRGDGVGPGVFAFGSTVWLTLNTTPGSETTAEELVDAVNQHAAASAMVIAEVVDADLTAVDPLNYAPINLGGGVTDNVGASMVSDFWTADGVQIEFTANVAMYPGAAGDGIRIDVELSDLGPDAPPLIATVAGPPPVITVTLNTHAGSQTTAEQLVQAIANDASASQIISAQVITPANSELTGLVTDHIVDNAPLSLDLLAGGGSTQATAHSDFGTSLDIMFTADPTHYPGDAGNAISILVQRQDLGAGVDPTVVVLGTTITATLNTTPGSETTPQQLVNKISTDAKDGVGNQMVSADIIPAAETDITGVAPVPATLNLELTEEYDFGTDGLVAVEFTAVDFAVAGGVITIDVTEANRAAAGVPGVSVSGSTISVELDTSGPTTAQQLLAEWTNAGADALATAARVLGNPVTSIVGGGAQTITLDVRNQFVMRDATDAFGPITLTDANQALVMSDFGAVNPLQLRLTADATGAAGDGIRMEVVSRALGAGVEPNVTVVGTNIYVELNSTADSETTAQQLIDKLRSEAGTLIDVTLLYGDPDEVLGGLPNPYSPLVLRGGDDAVVVPGYIGLPRDDPGVDNSDPDELLRINRNEVIIRFAETLPDDHYRIEIFGFEDVSQNISPLKNLGGDFFTPSEPDADREVVHFDLELGPQVISVVPQPVSRNVQRVQWPGGAGSFGLTFIDKTVTINAGDDADAVRTAMETGLDNVNPGDVVVTGTPLDWTIAFHGRHNYESLPLLEASDPAVTIQALYDDLSQADDQVLVYFNDDNLNPASAQDPSLYRLYDTKDSLDPTDDTLYLPTQVVYDADADMATLIFDNDDDPSTDYTLPTASYRLDVGASDENNNATPDAVNLGTLFDTTNFEYIGYLGDDDGTTSTNGADSDSYRFNLSAQSDVDVTVDPEANLLSWVLLLRLENDGSLTYVGDALAGLPGDPATVSVNNLAAGTYIVEVWSFFGTDSYLLDIDVAGNPISSNDDNSAFATATELGVLGEAGQTYDATIGLQAWVQAPPYPGGEDEPGHRQIPSEWHIPFPGTGTWSPGAIAETTYFFGDVYATDANGNDMHNQITENQKARAREILEIVSTVSGRAIREQDNWGTVQVVVGDVCANGSCDPPSIKPPARLGGTNLGQLAAIMDINYDYGTSPYGGNFFTTTLHELIHLWLFHSSDVPSTMTGYGGNGPPADGVYPGLNDVVHLQRYNRPDATDIDLYEFQADEPGRFTAEIVAERLGTTGQLNSVLTLFDAAGNVLARNDDYFSNDSYLDIELEPGTYYVGVTSTGNLDYDPDVSDSGAGGPSAGDYQLRLNLVADPKSELVDLDASGGTVLERFTILLADGLGDPRPNEGTGVNANTVTPISVTVSQDRVPLVEGQDFTLGFNPDSNLLMLTPLSGLWEPHSVYQITLDNRVIQDRAGNKLRSNQPTGETQFTIILGDIGLDYGDAPDTHLTLLASGGARHAMLPDAPLYLGERVDADADGQPNAAANGDDNDSADNDEDGILIERDLGNGWTLDGVFNKNTTVTPITITASGAGLVDAWVDFNGNGEFDSNPNEQILDSEPVVAGTQIVNVSTPSWATPGTDRYARFRIVPAGDTSPVGAAIGGEVEDYKVSVKDGRPPVAVDDEYEVDEDDTLNVANFADGVLQRAPGNDTDADGSPVTGAVLVSGPTYAAEDGFQFNADGTFVYLAQQDFNGQDTFTYRAIDDTGLTSNNTATVTITVRARNDAPDIASSPNNLDVDEDALVVLPAITLHDQDHDGQVVLPDGTPQNLVYDPTWEGQVTLSVKYGVLSLATTNGLTFPSDIDGDGVDDDVNGDGFVNANDVSDGVDDSIIVFRGSLSDLNAALDGITYRGQLNYNSGDPTSNPADTVPEELLKIHVDDLNNTDDVKANNDMFARSTVTITVNPKQDQPTIPTVPVVPNNVVMEDTLYVLDPIALADVDHDSQVTLPDGTMQPFVYDPDWEGQVTLSVNYGVLSLATTNGLTFPSDIDGDGLADDVNGDGSVDADDVSDGVNDSIIVFRGLLADLNAAVAAVTYQGQLHYNSGDWTSNPADAVPNDTLTIKIEDLGNTDVLNLDGNPFNDTAWMSSTETVDFRVNPKQDQPTIPTVPGQQIVDEDTALLLPAFEVLDVDPHWHVDLADDTQVELVYDPDWTGRVTLTVNYGTLWLNDPAGVTYAGGNTSTVTLTGGLDALNNALRDQNVRYQGNPHFNSLNWETGATDFVPHDTLTITIDDQGNTDMLNLDADPNNNVPPGTTSDTVEIIVNPKQDVPEIPTVPGQQTVDEDMELKLPAFEVFDNDARSSLIVGPTTFEYDPDWTGTVTLTVNHGTLWLNDPAGVTYTGHHTSTVTLAGDLDALNTALRNQNVSYQGEPGYNSGDPAQTPPQMMPDILTIRVDDQGNTDILNRDADPNNDVPAETAEKTVEITVTPINDAPVLTVPGPQSLDEGTDGGPPNTLAMTGANGISVSDTDAGEAGGGPIVVTFSIPVGTGTLTVSTGVGVIINGNRTETVTLTGTVAQINAVLSSPTGVTYTVPDDDFSNNVNGGDVILTVHVTVPVRVCQA